MIEEIDGNGKVKGDAASPIIISTQSNFIDEFDGPNSKSANKILSVSYKVKMERMGSPGDG